MNETTAFADIIFSKEGILEFGRPVGIGEFNFYWSMRRSFVYPSSKSN